MASLLVMPADYSGPRSMTIGKARHTPELRGLPPPPPSASTGFGSRVSASLFAPTRYNHIPTQAPAVAPVPVVAETPVQRLDVSDADVAVARAAASPVAAAMGHSPPLRAMETGRSSVSAALFSPQAYASVSRRSFASPESLSLLRGQTQTEEIRKQENE